MRTSKASGSLSVLYRVCQSLRPPFLSPTLVLCCVVKTGIWRNHGIPATWGSETKNWIHWRRPNGFGISQRIHIFGIDYAKSNIGICPFRQQLGKKSWRALIRKEWIFVPDLSFQKTWREFKANTTHDNKEIVQKCDFIFLAVKPHIFPIVLRNLRENLEAGEYVHLLRYQFLYLSSLCASILDLLQLNPSFSFQLWPEPRWRR